MAALPLTRSRRSPGARRLAWAVWALTALLVALVAALVLATPASSAPRSYQPTPVDYLMGLVLLTFATVGALILTSQPGNRVGWICSAIGLGFALQALVLKYAAYALFANPSAPAGVWSLWVTQWIFAVPFVLVGSFLPLLFPDGRIRSRRWAAAAAVAVAAGLVLVLQRILWPEMDLEGYRLANPTGAGEWRGLLEAVNTIGGLALVAAFLASAASVLVRFRDARAEQRQQLKWFTSAITVLVLALAASFLAGSIVHFGAGVSVLLAIGFLAIPISIAIAVLHNHLFDIDLVISRTLMYGTLAVFITVVYLVVVLGAGTLLGTGTRGNIILSILATAIVGVAFQPVRERMQRLASRLVYGQRATPYEALSVFSHRVAEAYAGDEVLNRMARVLADATGAAQACVWLRVGDRLRLAASAPVLPDSEIAISEGVLPALPDADTAAEVRHQDELLGALTIKLKPGERLSPREQKLLADLAVQAGLVLRNVRLTTQLTERMRELQASRQRLVRAQDEERRRLERNLHDGAQQHLVALKVKLGLAETLAKSDPTRVRELVTQLQSDADEALETLRDLARGIYPPVLTDHGLEAALQAQARKASLSVAINCDRIGRYDAEVEAAIYFCCLEALQNATKYSQASTVTIALEEVGGELHFRVADDGRGFDPLTAGRGSGLQNMRDRLDALGGSLRIDSRPGGGTAVSGSAPTAVPAPSA